MLSRRNASALLACLVSLLAITCDPFDVQAQTATTHPAAKGSSVKKVRDETNAAPSSELTLANLRPGRDAIIKAERFFSKPESTADSGSSQLWRDLCAHETLSVITDSEGTIQQVTVARGSDFPRTELCKDCHMESTRTHWTTGHGLVIGDPSDRVIALYGQPGSRGPSTKGGQKLELFYYAFDWAGPDVPQVMTVLCTPGQEGSPGRVVEITLAAPSL
jgi:hypothetical protein